MDRESFEKRKKVVYDLVHDKHYIPMKRKEMAMLFNLPKEQRGDLYDVLDALVAEGTEAHRPHRQPKGEDPGPDQRHPDHSLCRRS